MKLEDLRINNIVQPVDSDQNTDLDKYSVCIQGIDNNSMWGDSILISDTVNKSTRDVLLKQVKPILITKEVLLKCGFERFSINFTCSIKDLKTTVAYKKDNIVYDISTKKCWVGFTELSHIKYLHQLQNLYYMVENKELEIEMKE